MYLINKYGVKNKEYTFIEINQKNIRITLMDYGATIMSIYVPDKDGNMETVLLAYDSLESYIENDIYLNATIGPNSGRLKDAKYKINNEIYNIEKNFLNSENLHSGSDCFAFKFFDYEIIDNLELTKVTFKYKHDESKSVFKGNQDIEIIYTVTSTQILIEFKATTDKDALLNITNHAYFNLSGNLKNIVLNHKLQVNSSKIMELDSNFVPYIIKDNKEEMFNFKNLKTIKDSYNENIYKLPTLGIDHPFILDDIGFKHKQVTLIEPISKRVLEIYTSYPCIVVYTHNYPDDKKLLFGIKNTRHLGICFETQNEPNGINIDGVRNSILKKEGMYNHKTLYKFSVLE